jgi:hypothetical protein
MTSDGLKCVGGPFDGEGHGVVEGRLVAVFGACAHRYAVAERDGERVLWWEGPKTACVECWSAERSVGRVRERDSGQPEEWCSAPTCRAVSNARMCPCCGVSVEFHPGRRSRTSTGEVRDESTTTDVDPSRGYWECGCGWFSSRDRPHCPNCQSENVDDVPIGPHLECDDCGTTFRYVV